MNLDLRINPVTRTLIAPSAGLPTLTFGDGLYMSVTFVDDDDNVIPSSGELGDVVKIAIGPKVGGAHYTEIVMDAIDDHWIATLPINTTQLRAAIQAKVRLAMAVEWIPVGLLPDSIMRQNIKVLDDIAGATNPTVNPPPISWTREEADTRFAFKGEDIATGDTATPDTGVAGADGDKGWSPKTINVVDGQRVVQQLVDYVGGTGTKPTGDINKYVGPAGYVTLIADATDIRGATGANGTNGTNGTNGAAGVKGDTGDTGAQGNAGSAGVKGDTGDTGNAGAQGVKGDTGDAGADGSTGATGDTGLKGDTGDGGSFGDPEETGQLLHSTGPSTPPEWKLPDPIKIGLHNGAVLEFSVDVPNSRYLFNLGQEPAGTPLQLVVSGTGYSDGGEDFPGSLDINFGVASGTFGGKSMWDAPQTVVRYAVIWQDYLAVPSWVVIEYDSNPPVDYPLVGTVLYYSTSNTTYPWQATGWVRVQTQTTNAITVSENAYTTATGYEAHFTRRITAPSFNGSMDTGDVGPEGPEGPKGDTGDTGDTGANGNNGAQGVKGDTGDPGADGDTGDTGAQGIQGNPGVKGDTGDVGDTGDPGIDGDTGDTGASVPSLSSDTITYASTITPDLDSALVNVRNVGTLTANVTIAAPTGETPADGWVLKLRYKQNGTGGWTSTYNAIYQFTGDCSLSQIPVNPNAEYVVVFEWWEHLSKWIASGINRF